MLAQEQTIKTVWRPQPGPQAAFVQCPNFEVFFGGARGGGKSWGVIGDWALHSDKYGQDAVGLMIRRTRIELLDLFEQARGVFSQIGATSTFTPLRITMPNGARLTFAYLERDPDADQYQGHNYCVAVGTRIRMADGALKPIEQIQVGEVVATLEGPRRVRGTTAPYLAPCVEALVRDACGAVLGTQRHPIWHPVLTSAGLTSPHTHPTRHSVGRSRRVARAPSMPAGQSPDDAGQELPAWLAWSVDGRSDCKASRHSPGGFAPPQRQCVPVVLHAPPDPLTGERGHAGRTVSTLFRSPGKWSGSSSRQHQRSPDCSSDRLPPFEPVQSEWGHSFRARPSAPACVPSGWQSASDSRGDYLSDHGSGDGLFLPVPETDREGIPSPAGAVSTPHGSNEDAWGTTPTHSPRGQSWWVHPYSGEERRLSESVQIGTMEVRECGDAWVADLTVEGANHYISETGLINKNTRIYVEEIGNFPSSRPVLKLMATLRSGAGVPVGLRLTGNPGGPGHGWVRARYIDPAPLGWVEIIDKATGLDRIYIPSRVSDNAYLGPDYVQRLKASGSPELVRAWLEGDWSVVSGAFFPEFSLDRHVIAPRPIPEHWARFRSFDWGSARPFCCHWWAVSDGSDPDIARGALVLYREWYGMRPGEPNVGLKLTAEAVAQGIATRETDDPQPMLGVADPAIFAEDGGPSIAQRMMSQGVMFRPADNKRVPSRGAMGGWDQLRSRLVGDDDGRPMALFFSTARDLIRTLPAMQHDDARPEDIDTDAEDHCCDCARYGMMSRPWIKDAVKPKPRDSWDAAFDRASAETVDGWRVA